MNKTELINFIKSYCNLKIDDEGEIDIDYHKGRVSAYQDVIQLLIEITR